MNRHILLAAVMGCSGLTHVQASESLTELDYLTDMPIVLSVSRLPQRLDETPGAVTILDRDMIRLSGARDVADLLRLVPGFQTSTSFESGAPLASYHGGFDSYSARMQVLLDGRSVYSPYYLGSVSLGLLSVALVDIERIEVLRGSNSAAYGARAMLGVVNIVTRHTGDTIGGQVVVTQGENGIRDRLAGIGWGDQNASSRVTFERRGDDGLKGSNGHNQLRRVNLRSDLHLSGQDEVQLRAGLLELRSGLGFHGEAGRPVRDREVDSSYVQLDWRRTLSSDEDLTLSLSRTDEVSRDSYLHPLGVVVDYGGRSRNDTLLLQHTFRSGPSWRVVWGGELRREQVVSKPLYYTGDALVTDFTRLFGNAEWRVTPSVIVNAGGMLENSSVHGNTFAPRVMVNWHFTEGQTLRAGMSRAFRPPSTFEKFSDVRFQVGSVQVVTVQSSGSVQPESVLSREFGYLVTSPEFGFKMDARLFHEQIDGYVRRVASVPYDFRNDENFAIQGLEYQLTWQPWRDAKVMWGQSFTRVDSQLLATSGAAPKVANTLMVSQRLPGGLDVSVMHQNSSSVTPQGAGVNDIVPTERTDLRLGLPLRWGRQTGELAVVVQNLGLPYLDFDFRFRFERRAFVTFRLDF